MKQTWMQIKFVFAWALPVASWIVSSCCAHLLCSCLMALDWKNWNHQRCSLIFIFLKMCSKCALHLYGNLPIDTYSKQILKESWAAVHVLCVFVCNVNVNCRIPFIHECLVILSLLIFITLHLQLRLFWPFCQNIIADEPFLHMYRGWNCHLSYHWFFTFGVINLHLLFQWGESCHFKQLQKPRGESFYRPSRSLLTLKRLPVVNQPSVDLFAL